MHITAQLKTISCGEHADYPQHLDAEVINSFVHIQFLNLVNTLEILRII